MRNTRVSSVIVLASLTVLLAPTSSPAQAPVVDVSTVTLDELMNLPIVTASRISERSGNAPARVQIVTGRQIQRRGYRSLIDVLKDISDFKVDLAGDQDYPAELTVQGSRGAGRVIVLLDGIRISSPTNDPLPILANYPVHSARQIEILYGAASAVYGADAFSAVINIVSRDAETPGLASETSVGQDGLYNQTASYATRVGDSGSLLLAGQFLRDAQPDLSRAYPADFQGLQAQRTGTFNTIFGAMQAAGALSPAYEVPLSARSLQATLKIGGLHLSVFHNESRVSTAPPYTPDNTVYNGAAFNRNDMLVVSGSHTHRIGPATSTSTLTLSRHELDPESGYWNVYSNMTRSYKYAFGSMLKAEEQLVWKLRSATTVTTGATAERFFSIPQGADLNAPVHSRDHPGTILGTTIQDDFVRLRYFNFGGYAQLQHALTGRLTATLGARGDYNTRYGGTFNPRLGLLARVGMDTTLKVLYARAYLAPSPYQSYAHYGAFYSTDGGATYASDYWHLPNPDLKPQHKQSIEVTLQHGLRKGLSLMASSFYTHITDKIQESDPDQAGAGVYKGWPVSYIDFAVNGGADTIYGGTVALDFMKALASNQGVDARAAVTLANGRESRHDPAGAAIDLPIAGMAPVRVNLGVDIRHGRWSVAPSLTASGRQRLRATQTIAGAVERRTLDGYVTVAMHVRRRDVFKELDVFVRVENMLDARYRNINMRAYTNPEELIGAPQNPRRLTIGFQY